MSLSSIGLNPNTGLLWGLPSGKPDSILAAIPRQHQPVDRLIHHRLVINRQKLLADSLGNRVKTCAGAAGEDDAFHGQVIEFWHAVSNCKLSFRLCCQKFCFHSIRKNLSRPSSLKVVLSH